MIHLPEPMLNGIPLSHLELRVIHSNMRIAVHAATGAHCLDGPRLLIASRGEYYELRAHRRDRHGCLLASVTVRLPWCNVTYRRRVRLVKESRSLLAVESV
jgi:hypothetical protein